MNFKKISVSLLAAAMLAGCGSGSAAAASTAAAAGTAAAGTAAAANKTIDSLSFVFVPSRDPGEILDGTKDLPQLVIDEMAKHGYTIGNIDITVSDSYEAAGEALASGTAQVAWLPGGTYALYSQPDNKEADVILTATRAGLSNDSENPADWNGDANATQKNGPQVTFYRALIYATPSDYGKQLAEKVNNGEKLTWDDLDKAQWAVMNVSSSAGYIYPTLWLMHNYDGKTINDLSHVTTLDGYAAAFQQAAAGSVDVIVCYADGRNDYEKAWNLPTDQTDDANHQGLGRVDGDSIWNELNVIGVTDKIYNDTVAVTTADPDINNDEFKSALQDSLINIINTDEGAKIFAIYSHTGYAKATDADYDVAREALKAVESD